MHLTDFMVSVRKGQIPPEPPDGLSVSGYSRPSEITFSYYTARAECTEKYNMWAIVSDDFARQLAAWIGPRKALEVMAGGGWLAKALAQNGVNIVATDNYGWQRSNGSTLGKPIYPVRRFRAENAVVKIPADILIVSWPPYGDATIIKVCDTWGADRPIVYIGEDEGGCDAPDEFFERFKRLDEPVIPLVSWDGIHDQVMVGYWS